jgi:hypothetical protein
MQNTIFFSSQSDRPAGRVEAIEYALKDPVALIARDVTGGEAVRDGLKVDKDTKGVPGSPPSSRRLSAKSIARPYSFQT